MTSAFEEGDIEMRGIVVGFRRFMVSAAGGFTATE